MWLLQYLHHRYSASTNYIPYQQPLQKDHHRHQDYWHTAFQNQYILKCFRICLRRATKMSIGTSRSVIPFISYMLSVSILQLRLWSSSQPTCSDSPCLPAFRCSKLLAWFWDKWDNSMQCFYTNILGSFWESDHVTVGAVISLRSSVMHSLSVFLPAILNAWAWFLLELNAFIGGYVDCFLRRNQANTPEHSLHFYWLVLSPNFIMYFPLVWLGAS